MPGGDGTGPLGMGPMSGRGAGYCAGYSVPGYANPGNGRGYFGYGRGRGGGRGWRNRYYAAGMPYGARGFQNYPLTSRDGYPASELSADSEIKMLKEQAEFMQKEAAAIHERIKELESLSAEPNKKS